MNRCRPVADDSYVAHSRGSLLCPVFTKPRSADSHLSRRIRPSRASVSAARALARRFIPAPTTTSMIWFVALGSALGGVTRFLLSGFLQQKAGTVFPIGTLVVNISGSLLLGFLMTYALSSTAISPEVRGLLTTGFCGGYTTFSTFSYEAMMLVEEGEIGRAAAYILLSVVVALIGAYLGITAARELIALRER